MSTTKRTIKLLIVLALSITMLAPAFAVAPTVQSTAHTLADITIEGEVPIGESLGIHFNIQNVTGGNVPNSPCTLCIMEWRDNQTYTLQNYRVRPECFNPDFFALTGVGDEVPSPCYFQSDEGGVVSVALPITYELGYHVHPNNTMTGGYGNYAVHIHCGNKTELNHEANFTVIHAAEPTWVIDSMWWSIDYSSQFVIIIAFIVGLAIFIYFIKALIWG